MTSSSRTFALLSLVVVAAGAATAEPVSPADAYREAVRWEHGEGVPRDVAKALDLYCLAADSGNADAAYAIGWMLLNGRGVGRDETRAVAWLAVAAAAGKPQARRLLEHFSGVAGADDQTCAAPEAPAAATPAPVPVAAPAEYAAMVEETAPRFDLDPDLVLAVMAVESAFRPDAVSEKNAQGLMQLIPATAERFGVADPFDPADNLRGGVRYLRVLIDMFDGDLRLALAAYNAGEGTVLRYGGVPPYPETLAYLERIARHYPLPPADGAIVLAGAAR